MKHHSPVYRAASFRALLTQKFELYGHDLEAVLHFLLLFKFVRKITRGREIFYMIGSKSEDHLERFQVDEKYLEMQLERMKQQEAQQKQIILKLRPQYEAVKNSPSALAKTRKQGLLIKITRKVKAIKELQKKMLFLTNRLEQFRNAQTDVEMKMILEDTNKTLENREDVLGVIQNAAALNQEMSEGQEQISNLVGELGNNEEDILKAFNDLDKEDVDFNVIDTEGLFSEKKTDIVHNNNNTNIMNHETSPNRNDQHRIIEEIQVPKSAEVRQDVLFSPEVANTPNHQNEHKNRKIYKIGDVRTFAEKKFSGFGEVNPAMQLNTTGNTNNITNTNTKNTKTDTNPVPPQGQTEVIDSAHNTLSFGQKWKSHKSKTDNDPAKNYDQFKRDQKQSPQNLNSDNQGNGDAQAGAEFHGTFRGTNNGTDSLCEPSEMNGDKAMKDLMRGEGNTNNQIGNHERHNRGRRVKSTMDGTRNISESQTKTTKSVPDRNCVPDQNHRTGRDDGDKSFVGRVIDYGMKWFGSGRKESGREGRGGECRQFTERGEGQGQGQGEVERRGVQGNGQIRNEKTHSNQNQNHNGGNEIRNESQNEVRAQTQNESGQNVIEIESQKNEIRTLQENAQEPQKIVEEMPPNDYRVDFSAPIVNLSEVENPNTVQPQDPVIQANNIPNQEIITQNIGQITGQNQNDNLPNEEPSQPILIEQNQETLNWNVSNIEQNNTVIQIIEPEPILPSEIKTNDSYMTQSRLKFNTTLDYIKRPNDKIVGNLSAETSNINTDNILKNDQVLKQFQTPKSPVKVTQTELQNQIFEKPVRLTERKSSQGQIVHNLVEECLEETPFTPKQTENQPKQDPLTNDLDFQISHNATLETINKASNEKQNEANSGKKNEGKGEDRKERKNRDLDEDSNSQKKRRSAKSSKKKKSSSKKSSKKKMKFSPWGQKTKNSLKKDLY